MRTSKRAVRERLAWERRALCDIGARGPLTYCYPGFMGAVCERLVAKGLADREHAGRTIKPESWPKGSKFEAAEQYRYTLTDAGRALLPA